MQAIQCEVDGQPRLPWTGTWPGVAECLALGIVDEQGRADLNELPVRARWDAAQRTWALR